MGGTTERIFRRLGGARHGAGPRAGGVCPRLRAWAGRRQGTSRSGGAALLLAVAVTAAACGSGGGSASSRTTTTHSKTPVSKPPATTSATAPPTTYAVLTAGQVGSRRMVPWSKIGGGWLLATWSTSPAVAAGAVTPPSTIELVDPQGGRYDLGPAPATGVLTDWSGSGSDALFLVPAAPAATGTINYGAVVVDLQTGTTTRFSVGSEVGPDAVQFSKPDGTAVILAGPQVRRYSVSGALEKSYPSSVPGSPASATTGGAFAETPTGTELALSAAGGIDVMANGGAPQRFIGPPPGQQPCTVDGLWQVSSVLENCGAELWTQPLSGALPNHLATASTGTTLLDAWMVGTRVVAEAGACGTTWLETASPGGTLSTISVPDLATGGSVDPLGAHGSQLAVVLRPGCDRGTAQQQGATLGWFDPVANTFTPLLGGLANGGTVDASVLFHGPAAGGGTQAGTPPAPAPSATAAPAAAG